MSKKKAEKITVGYSYYIGLHMGIARAIDALVEIRVGDKQAWKGHRTGAGRFAVDAPDLFGGREAEGGVRGEFDLMLGGSGQTITTKLRKMLTGSADGLCPSFRGFVSAHFDGMYSQMNPYPKRWGFRVRRTQSGWTSTATWYPEKIRILMGDYDEDDKNGFGAIHAMNPAHIIMYLLTDTTTGRGLPQSTIDMGSFRQAADALYNEGFGLCLKWSRSGSVSDFIQIVLDHIGGALFQDRFTGRIRLSLIRDDYEVEDLPIYTVDTGVLAIEKAEVAAKPAVVNEVIVEYRNPVTNEEGSARVQNLGSMQGDDAIHSTTLDYPGLPTPQLANKVGQRELRSRGAGLRRFTLKCDRRAFRLQPADVFVLEDETRGISRTVLRVVDYEDGSTNDNAITLTAVQDIFAFPLSEFTEQQPGENVPQDPKPELARRLVYEVPYVWLRRNLPDPLFSQMSYTDGYLGAGAEQPNGQCMGYRLALKREGEDEFTNQANGQFIPLGELAFGIGYFDTEITLVETSFLEYAEEGLSLMIEDEIIEVLSIEFSEVDMLGDPVDGSDITLTVGRGTSDTRPWQHAPGRVAWFFDADIGTDLYEYAGGESLEIKIRPYTLLGGAYPMENTPIDYLTFDYRYTRPYLPGRAELDGAPWFVPGGVKENEPAVVTWTHRDRVQQSDVLVHHEDGDIGPEPNSWYNVVVKNAEGDVIRDDRNITGTSWQYDLPTALADIAAGEGSGVIPNVDVEETVYLKLQTQRPQNGTVFDSWQNYEMALKVEAFKYFVWVAQYARSMAQETDYRSMLGLYLGQYSRALAHDGGYKSMLGLYVAQETRSMAQETAFPRTPDRWVRERPYIDQKRQGVSTAGRHLIAVAVQPSDLIPEHYDFFAAQNPGNYDPVEETYPPAVSDMGLYSRQSNNVPWARWGILSSSVDHEQTRLSFSRTSVNTGLSLFELKAGTLVTVGAELMAVTDAGEDWLDVKRGTADTIPATHPKGLRVFVLERDSGDDRIADTRLYPDKAIVETKVREQSFAGEVKLNELATDRTEILDRVSRPYPPGDVRTNGNPWWESAGRISEPGETVTVTWADRNRITQGTEAVEHGRGSIAREAGAQYRLEIHGPRPRGSKTPNIMHSEIVDGESWTLDYSLARSIGYSAAQIRGGCGSSGVTLTLFTIRDELKSWQGYTIRLVLPAPECPPGREDEDKNENDSGSNGTTGDGSFDGSHDNNDDHDPDKDDEDDKEDTTKPDEPPEPPDEQDPEPEDPNEDGEEEGGENEPTGGKWSRGWGLGWGADNTDSPNWPLPPDPEDDGTGDQNPDPVDPNENG